MSLGKRLIATDSVAAAVIDFFNPKLYSGGLGGQVIDVGFQPDLIIGKRRDSSEHWWVNDALRSGKSLFLNTTDAQISFQYTTPNSNGFVVNATGGVHNAGNLVAYCFKAGGVPTAVNSGGQTPTSGSKMVDGASNTSNFATATSYPKRQSINSTKKFSITEITKSSTGINLEIPHSLGTAPDFIILRPTTTEDWQVWHSAMGTGAYMSLTRNDNGAGAGKDNSLARTVSFQTVNSNIIENSWTSAALNWICYAWAEEAGVSKFGSFSGSGSGTSITGFGFSPKLLIVKSFSGSSNTDWLVIDSERGANKQVYANTNNSEQTGSGWSLDSDGFTPDGGTWDASGTNYIYMAWA